MTRVFLAEPQTVVRSALRLVLSDLGMEVVGAAADWPAALEQAAPSRPDLLVVDWALIPTGASLRDLRASCKEPVTIVLISQLDAREQAALAAGADTFISKGDTPDRVSERLQVAAAATRTR